MIGALPCEADDFLRGRGRFAPGRPVVDSLGRTVIFLVLGGLIYGAVMGSYAVRLPGHAVQLFLSAVKVPMLLLATTALCVPSFYVVNVLAGLRDDFGDALQAIVTAQACLTVVLASLAPVTAFLYISGIEYGTAVLLNAMMFGFAAVAAQAMMHRYYRPLIARSWRHVAMLAFWFVLYAFVGTQMGWVLRPFIGDPKMAPEFFRSDAWGNAYEVILRLVGRVLPP